MPIYALGERHPDIHPESWVAETATVIGSVIMRQASSLWFGAVARGDRDVLTLGLRSNVQDGAVLHTDPGLPLEIGMDVTIGHQAMLHGCRIEDGCLIGIQATILNGAVIGAGSLIGAQTLIPEGKIIPPRSMVLGSPGKVVRELSEQEAARWRESAARYVENWQRYHAKLRRLTPP